MQQNYSERPTINYDRIFSPYKIGMFDQCPQNYFLSYVNPITKGEKNKLKKLFNNIFSFQTLGKAVHSAITLFYYLPIENRNLKNLKLQLQKTWISEAMKNKKMPLGEWGGFESIEVERDSYRVALMMLENFFRMRPQSEVFEFLPSEKFLSLDDYHNLITPLTDEFDISGKFDLVLRNPDGTLEIIDFKTGKKDEIKEFQMVFYKLLAELKFGQPVSKLSLYFLRSGRKVEIACKDEIEPLKTKITNIIQAIKDSKEFPTKPDRLCRYCIFRNQCPDKENVRKIINEGKFSEDNISDDLPF